MFYDCVIKTHAPVNYIYTRLSEHHDFFFLNQRLLVYFSFVSQLTMRCPNNYQSLWLGTVNYVTNLICAYIYLFSVPVTYIATPLFSYLIYPVCEDLHWY